MKFNNFRHVLAATACMAAMMPGDADAQIWIGQIVGDMMAQGQAAQQEHACMTGTPMPENEVAEAHQPAIATMTGYFDAAMGKTSFASYFNLDKHSRWTNGPVSADMTAIGMQDDPFARSGLVLDAAPLGFVRSGDASTALGQWIVRDAAGVAGGTYTASFTRRTGVWRLSTLTLTPMDTYVDPVVQYCHKPGDVLPYRIVNTRAIREMSAKRAAKAEVKAQRASAATAKALARAEASPGNKAAREAAIKAGAREKQLAEIRETRRKELDDAQAAETQALADAKVAEETRAAALAALGGAK